MKADHIVEALTGDSGWKDMIPQVNSSDFPTQWVPSAYECSIIDAQAKEIEKLRGQLRHLGKLAEADRDGRVVVRPCKVGDTLFRVFAGGILEHKVGNMRYLAIQERWDIDTIPFCSYVESSIGKTIFLTREEAEKALEAKSNA
uniref:Uncharacterized protein n=1 Tax=Myoviridae sp. ctBCv9 TaxID=2825045 RepID=A0A8S5U6L8_9CAUD|nr:MAG TPA: hypothetical protein [Myoviridae sp. ctBCv9]